MSSWSDRAQAYRESETHRAGADLDLLVEWCEPAEGVKALDVATGGGHVARRLRELGAEVVTLDPSPGMRADVLASAEHIPFDDGAFDVVVTRIAPHHFEDIRAAVGEFERVSNRLVVIEDTLYSSERHEQAEKLRDPTHVRCYTEDEWRGFFADAGVKVVDERTFERRVEVEPWLARVETPADDAARVRELLAEHIEDGRVTLRSLVLKGVK